MKLCKAGKGRIKTRILDVQKAYDTVWRGALWLKLWDMGIKGRMWRVIKKMYEASRSTVFRRGEVSYVQSLYHIYIPLLAK